MPPRELLEFVTQHAKPSPPSAEIAEGFFIADPLLNLNIVKADPKDNKIIECAVVGKADYVVSGDKHLLDIKEYDKIKIISPKEFLEIEHPRTQ